MAPATRTLAAGLQVSPIGYGGWQAGGGATWGANQSARDVIAAIHAGLDAGMTWIDTAEVYGGGGGSETIIGRAVARRPDTLVCTKVAPRPDGSGLRPADIAAAARASLRRLRRDTIDLYYVHWPDPDIDLAETWGAMAELVYDGIARHIGLSTVHAQDVERCHHAHPVACVQLQGSALYLDELDGLGRWCAAHHIGVVAYGPLAFGLLADPALAPRPHDDWRGGVIGQDDIFVRDNHARFFTPDARVRHQPVIAAVARLAADAGLTLPALMIAWLLRHDSGPALLCGTRDRGHAVANARSAGIVLDGALADAVTAAVRRQP
ncbi:MAG: aldo/keto reductase [Solirubrobacteraceae bacterium]